MNVDDVPIVGEILESGAEDRVFDSLLLVGPFLIVLIAIVGRSPITSAIAIAYLLFFVAYVLYRGLRHEDRNRS
ncbi:hypothetical protein [Natrinema salifodinae]|uniref:Uncharacterized protein n=1 Tax=Natrinema salifodinae TaxID=1202768 RepID=A0A1I0M8W3_9EURY|nr:hypothetical protein [Natrinema salifodinae]SEV84146.1 hypothetical protein SAMN05216285_0576 [Natrinema salifodinae]